ncbi:acyl-CoA thioesterase [Paracoccus sp. (in: a-proteobacteria)]|uniref:acyl-CoA thioesterase n=1 Tax=Paracoccus sp. TaxID=267 RepID=UPI003A8842D2
MYPFLRYAKEIIKFRNAAALGPTEPHVSTHRCWPWDLDPWVELNNGRTLTLYDLGRLPLAHRLGVMAALKRKGWGMTVAGNSTRYRRRIRAFDRFTMISRVVGWDSRFIYMDQSMWKDGECCNQMLVRSAVTSDKGIVAPALLIEALGHPAESPPMPGWVMNWIEADAARPWPPLVPADAQHGLGSAA